MRNNVTDHPTRNNPRSDRNWSNRIGRAFGTAIGIAAGLAALAGILALAAFFVRAIFN